MKKTINKIYAGESGGVLRGMLTLLMGTGFARMIGLCCMPILARIYSPQDFGVLALYTSFVTILAPAFTLFYVQAIPLPKTDLLALNIFSLCVKIILIFSLIFSFVFLFFGEVIFSWFNMSALSSFWWLIVLGAAGTAFYESLIFWATRKKQYKIISKSMLIQSLIGNFSKIIFGLLSFKSLGLIMGQCLNQSAGIGNVIKYIYLDFNKNIRNINFKKEFFLARYYQDFVWYRLPSQFLMILSVQAPVILMARLYNEYATGQLSLAIMAISLPIGLIGRAMAKAYYAEIASIGKHNFNKIRRITISIQKKLFLVGIPIAITAYFSAEPLFKLIFGNDWVVAGKFAALLAPFILFQFTSSPLMEAINVMGRQSTFLLLHSFRTFGFLVIYLYFKSAHYDMFLFVAVLSVYLSLFYLSASLLILYMLAQKSCQGNSL